MSFMIVFQAFAHSQTLRRGRAFFSILFLSTAALWLFLCALSPADAEPMPSPRFEQTVIMTHPASLAFAAVPAFDQRRTFGPPNTNTDSVAVGDLNGDNALDIVTGVGNGQNVVYLNDGYGRFPNTGAYTRAFGTGKDKTYMVSVGDMNGDGALDIVAGNGSGEHSMVHLNDGTGTFPNTGEYTRTVGVESDSVWHAVGDVNGDGALDVIVNNLDQLGVVYLNDGMGNFPYTSEYTRTFGTMADAYQPALGDMNGDGALDIVVRGGNDRPSAVYLNDGTGSFPYTSEYTRAVGTDASSSYHLAVGDVDGDDTLDIVLAGHYRTHTIYLNDGAANFPYTRTVGAGEDRGWRVALGDLNSDGALEIVIGIENTGGMYNLVYFNDGGGHYYTGTVDCAAPPTSARCFGTGTEWPRSIVMGDVNSDGALDIVMGNNNQSAVYLNNQAGHLPVTYDYGTPGMGCTVDLAVADLNSDGALDVIAGDNGGCGEPTTVYLNDGTGYLPNTSEYKRLLGIREDSTEGVAVGDMDGNGTLDVVASNYSHQNLIYVNDGAANFYTRTFGTGEDPTRNVVVGDMNGDGALDIAVASGRPDQPNAVYLNDGHGYFDNTSPYTRAFGMGSWYLGALVSGDLNGDGALDLVVGAWGESAIYINDGAANFADARPFGGEADRTYGVAVGDMNGDGMPDIVAGNDSQQNVVYLNDGAGNFPNTESHVRYFGSGGDSTYSVAVADLNGDGALDIVVGNFDQQDTAYLNDGTGNFDTALTFGAASDWTESVAIGDMNNDGAMDIIVGQGTQDKVCLNGLAGIARLPNNPPYVALTRMSPLLNANFVYTNPALRTLTIPITYTLFDRENEPVRTIRASYSLDGGGRWYPAAAASSTVTTNLFTLGGALTFDGVDDYVSVPDSASLNIADELTLQAWIKLANTTKDQKVVGRTSIGNGYILGVSDGMLYPEIWDSTGAQYTFQAGNIPLNRWTHLAVTWRTDGEMIGYINGLPVHAMAASANPIGLNNEPLHIGSAPWGGYTVEGQIGDIRIYAHALSAEEIQATLMRTLTDTAPGLVGYWLFGEGQGNTAFDQTSYHNDGTLINGPMWTKTAFPHIYHWDIFASGFFGQSDNVVFRIEADPSFTPAANSTPLYQRPYASATTFPFRVRGTQVRVMNGDIPALDAIVYRLPKDQQLGGTPIADRIGQPFRTDWQGYLQGRGQINPGDRLFALLPIIWTENYTLYYTSGTPTATGVDADVVAASGVQTLTVSASHPLILFNLDVSLEWNAHNDSAYLDQLQFNLQRASEYLYDFTDGQIALGNINLFQNGDEWVYSHIVVQANNRLRPFAIQGGIVSTDTVDLQHNTLPTDTILYSPGQVTMGSTWNRYGNPGQSLGEDWPIILAHELSHYLLFHDDTYIGMDPDGFLVPIATCLGSAMGDLYSNPDNTEFIADEGYWQANCADTLAEQTLERNEWETMQLWYPELVTPTAILSGPTTMPFDFTTVAVHDPYTPTDTLVDPTFYIDYQGGGGSSSEARTYLDRDEYVVNLGSPFGGQNRVIAHGAKPGDRLCVFDRPRAQFGCETIEIGDDRLAMRLDADWNPIVQISPVNSTTLTIHFSNTVPIPFPLYARIFPDLGYGEAPIPLTLVGDVYSGTFHLAYPAMSGNIQVWVDEPFTETDPRREAVVAYSIGGNPGTMRGAGGTMRGAGGTMRGAGGTMRGAGGTMRGAGAPIISPDGQMIFFTENPMDFAVGTFFTIQGMAGLPPLPPGRTLVGQGYNLVASPGVSLPFGSVSIQYLSNDVLVAGASEEDLTLYYWDGASWTALDTVLDTYFNLASAPSQGEGVYVLMASVKIPLYGPGWNLFAYSVHATQPVSEALLSIQGYYTTVYGYEPTDTTDPWKVYDTGVPTYVNDLEVLEFGNGYWINVSQAITLHLASGVFPMVADDVDAATMPLPPATFYGVVVPGSGFVPAPGMEVTAWIDGHLCGQAETMAVGGQVVYAINVLAEDTGAFAGCGAPGESIVFQVDSQLTSSGAVWDSRRLWELALRSRQHVYLPLVSRVPY